MTNITWKIPHVTPSDFAKFKMYDIIKSGVHLVIAFQSWELYVYPKLGYRSQHSWNMKLSANLITNNLSNLKVHLNSESYSYVYLNVDFSKNQYAHLHEMYTRIQSS